MKSNLVKRGFVSLLVTQFFGAANDNILKQVLIFMVGTGLWAGALGRGGEGYIALCLTVPFILLSAFAGQFADRHSKQRIVVLAKIVEIPVAVLALVGLWTQSLWLTMLAFVCLAIQSTFFGPAKYGVIPELVDRGDLSRANGTLNMLTNIAVIAGTVVAGPVCDAYFPLSHGDPSASSSPRVLWLPGLVLIVVAVMGLTSALFMPALKPQNPSLRYRWNPFASYVESLKEMAGGPLLFVALAWGFFYLVGMIAILILPKYTIVLGIDFTKTSYLLGVMAIAIGLGSVVAGLISGHTVEPRLVPIGAIGMTTFFLLLGTIQPSFWNVATLLLFAGFFAGFYIVPLQALLQKLSPEKERGRFLGAANGLSFCFSTLGGLIYWFCVGAVGLPANRVFIVCGGLALGGTGILLWRMHRLLGDASVRE